MFVLGKRKVMLLNPMLHKAGEEYLIDHGVEVEVVHINQKKVPKEILSRLNDVDGIIVRLPAGVDKELIESAPNLKIISSSGTGTDHIDVESATKNDVIVVNNAGVGARPVAEHVVGLMLALGKKIVMSNNELKLKGWESRESFLQENIGVELSGKTVGVIGFGHIGRETASILKNGFGTNIIAFDPFLPDEVFASFGAKRYDNVREICEIADYVTLHLPYLSETHHLIGKNELELMKSSAFFINCARGNVVDQDALIEAVTTGTIAGAGIDVFPTEPPNGKEIAQLNERIIATPHIAGLTEETNRKLSLSAAEQVLQVLDGEKPKNILNERAWSVRTS